MSPGSAFDPRERLSAPANRFIRRGFRNAVHASSVASLECQGDAHMGKMEKTKKAQSALRGLVV
jgi:hypothetical protein